MLAMPWSDNKKKENEAIEQIKRRVMEQSRSCTADLKRVAQMAKDGTLSRILRKKKGGRVLVCDDEPSIRKLLHFALDKLGIEVIEASDGEKCMEILADNDIGALIIDLHMPRMNGIQVLDEVKDANFSKFVVTGSALTEEEKNEIEEHYGVRVFEKPFDMMGIGKIVSDSMKEKGGSR